MGVLEREENEMEKKGPMEKKGQKWTVGDTLFWLGGGVISAGMAMLELPAGVISMGIFFLLGWFLVDHSGGEEK